MRTLALAALLLLLLAPLALADDAPDTRLAQRYEEPMDMEPVDMEPTDPDPRWDEPADEQPTWEEPRDDDPHWEPVDPGAMDPQHMDPRFMEPVPGEPFPGGEPMHMIAEPMMMGDGAGSMYLKLDGIQGASTAAGYQHGWMDLLSFSWGVTNGGDPTAGPGARTAPAFEALTVTKALDKASPQLALHCMQGKHIAEAKLEIREPFSNKTYLRLTLTDVTVSSYQIGTPPGASTQFMMIGPPTETVSLRYGKFQMEHLSYGPDGKPSSSGNQATWNLRANKQ